jgi:hypothetical protein
VRLPDELGAWWINGFRQRFVDQPDHYWWWESLTVTTETVNYEADGLNVISDIVDGWGPLALIVTNEKPEPEACFLGFPADLIEAIREVTPFEFVLSSVDLQRWLFDTHDKVVHVYSPQPS